MRLEGTTTNIPGIQISSLRSVETFFQKTAILEQLIFTLVIGLSIWQFLIYPFIRKPDGQKERFKLDKIPLEIGDNRISRRNEYLIISFILVFGAIIRLVPIHFFPTPPFTFTHEPTLRIARIIDQNNILAHWLGLFSDFQVEYADESVILFPIAVLSQKWLGPSFYLPVLTGALWGTIAIVFAWLLGRIAVGKVFALFFAAFVAISPLQIVWSRLGDYFIAGAAYILVVAYFSFLAGKRQSIILSVLAGLLAWASLYQYYIARIGIPLSFIAFLSAAHKNRERKISKILFLSLVLLSAISICFFSLSPYRLSETFWPTYTNYVGNKGETNIIELIEKNFAQILKNAIWTIDEAFLISRTEESRILGTWAWGIQHGGLILLPITILGLIGLAYVFARKIKHIFWLCFTALGFLVPLFSLPIARRILAFEIAYNGLAAFGACFLLQFLTRQYNCRKQVALVSVSAITAVTFYSLFTIYSLSISLPGHKTSLPFGQGRKNDGVTCVRCFNAALEWQKEFEKNNLVLLLDTDLARENPSFPGGLWLYGQISALNAQREDNFFQFYPLVRNFVAIPEVKSFYPEDISFVDFIKQKIERNKYPEILWHFENPLLWEQLLAKKLEQLGGKLEIFHTDLSYTTGIRVRTAKHLYPKILEFLHALESSVIPYNESCVRIDRKYQLQSSASPIYLIRAISDRDSTANSWLIGTWKKIEANTVSLDLPIDVNSFSFFKDSSGSRHIDILSSNGVEYIYNFETKRLAETRMLTPPPLPFACTIKADNRWWHVNPVTGKVFAEDDTSWIPNKGWMTLGNGGKEEILLGAVDGKVYVFDIQRKEIKLSFNTPQWPTSRFFVAECSNIIAGDNWYGVMNYYNSLLHVFSYDGERISSIRLDKYFNVTPGAITAAEAKGAELAVGFSHTDTIEVLNLTFADDLKSCKFK